VSCPILNVYCSTRHTLAPRGVIIIIDRPSHTVVDCRRPSFSGRCCTCLERTTTPSDVCTATFLAIIWRLIFSAVSFATFCSTCEVTRVIIGHFNRFATYLLCYSLTWQLVCSLFCSWAVCRSVNMLFDSYCYTAVTSGPAVQLISWSAQQLN